VIILKHNIILEFMKSYLLNASYQFFVLLMLVGQVNADQFIVQDQHGLPIENAILEFSVTSPITTNITPANTLIMDQINKRFEPEVLVIKQHDFVSFPNSDNIRHHVYSFSAVKPFELKLYSGKSKAPLQFNNAGISVLGCNIHDSMVGYIYIANSTQVLITDKQGIATLDRTIKYQSIKLWHANLSGSVGQTKQINYADLVTNSTDKSLFIIKLALDSPEPRNTFQSIFKKHGS